MSLGIKREHDFKTLLPYYKSYTNDFKRYKISNREKSLIVSLPIYRHLLLPLSL